MIPANDYGWSDAARRRENERLALQQPLVGLDYSPVPLLQAGARAFVVGLLVLAVPVLAIVGLLGMEGWL